MGSPGEWRPRQDGRGDERSVHPIHWSTLHVYREQQPASLPGSRCGSRSDDAAPGHLYGYVWVEAETAQTYAR